MPQLRRSARLFGSAVIVVVSGACSGSANSSKPLPAPTKPSVAVRDLVPDDVATDRFCAAVAATAALVDAATPATPATPAPPADVARAWRLVADEAPKSVRGDAETIAAHPGADEADVARTFEARSRLSRFFSGHCRGALGVPDPPTTGQAAPQAGS